MYGRERIPEIRWEKGDRSDPTPNIPVEQLDLVAFANHALGQSPAEVGPHLRHKRSKGRASAVYSPIILTSAFSAAAVKLAVEERKVQSPLLRYEDH